MKFTSLTAENALTQNSVLAITQDKRGFMWFGTRSGLNRYDAGNMVSFKSDPLKKTGLRNDYISALTSDMHGNVWVGTREGLYQYISDSNSFRNVPFVDERYNKLKMQVSCLYTDRYNNVWAGINGRIFRLVYRSRKCFLKEVGLTFYWNSGTLHFIFRDSKDILWIGGNNGLLQLTQNKAAYQAKLFQHRKGNNGLSDNAVFSMVEDRTGVLWLGTLNGGLLAFDRQTEQFRRYNHDPRQHNSLVNDHIRKVLLDAHNRLWIGTQEGVSVLDSSRISFTNIVNDPFDPGSLSQNSVHSLYQDSKGGIWIGTFFGGVNSYSDYNTSFQTYSNKSSKGRLSNNVVSSILETGDQYLWIGTEGGGLNLLNRQTGTVRYFKNQAGNQSSLSSNLVKVLYQDKQGNIWVGTHGGGFNLISKKGKDYFFIKYPFDHANGDSPGLEISAIFQDRRGVLWVGTEFRGLRTFKKEGSRLQPDLSYASVISLLKKVSVTAFAQFSDERIWIGTDQGVKVVFHHNLQTVKACGKLRINCLFEDHKGNVWVGTGSKGLMRLDSTGHFLSIYTQQSGLPDNNVLGILGDTTGNLWISTTSGLAKLEMSRNRFLRYDKNDGLPGNTFNVNAYCKTATGTLVFGGYDGIVLFNPSQVRENKEAAPFLITKFSAEGSKEISGLSALSNGGHIRLSYNQNIFRIGMASLNFVKAGKNRFVYRLEGYDKRWMVTANPSVTYSNVPPGEYSFCAKGSNNDGVWSKQATLLIRINPPLWKTPFAYIFYLLAFLAIVFVITRYFYLRALLKKTNKFTQFRLNFFTHVSHEIRTHLSLILAPVEKLMQNVDRNNTEKRQLLTIKQNTEDLLKLVNELMDFRKAETGHLPLQVSKNEVKTFIGHICDSFEEIAAAKRIVLDRQYNSNPLYLWFDTTQIGKVFYNLLSNAFKFTPESGEVRVQINAVEDAVSVRVINNGKGIARENLDKIFDNYFQQEDSVLRNTGYGIGLALSRSIVDLHGGRLTVHCETSPNLEGVLTIFEVILQSGTSHFQENQLVTSGMNSAPLTVHLATTETEESETVPQISSLDHSCTVLLVEDNDAIREFIKEALLSQYTVLESRDGLHGWEQAAESTPDIIISDIMMPGMDGIALCGKVKSDIRTSHIPVILLTAKNTEDSQESGLQTGADVYLTKPFSLKLLTLQVRNLLITRQRVKAHIAQVLKGPFLGDANELTSGEDGKKEGELFPALHPMDQSFLDHLIRITECNLDNPNFGVMMLSREAGMSQPVLFKKIKAITGLSANDFVKSLRIKKACSLLQENRYTIYEIAYKVGYENSKYFGREFKRQTGYAPSDYVKKMKVVANQQQNDEAPL